MATLIIIFVGLLLLFAIATMIILGANHKKQAVAKKEADRLRQKQEREAEKLEQVRKEKEQKQAAENLLLDFLKSNPYIAISDWKILRQQIELVCPSYKLSDDLLIKQNTAFRKQQKEEHREYFDSLLTYPLDEQQRDAIVTLGENVLVVAAAGSGKTSTIVAKVHYLVNKQNIDPRRILVLTYTHKAADELQTRVGVAGVECTTFHKHAINTIATFKGEKPTICDSKTLYKLFDSLIRQNPNIESSLFSFQTVHKNLLQYDYQYKSFRDYQKALQEYGKMTPYRDMDGNLCYVKSRQEMEIMVILTELGLNIRYEEKYPYQTVSTKFRQYKPDFTIHYTQDGKDKVLYLEHYAIDSHSCVPLWFGDGKQGGWVKANQEYNEGIRWKQEVHACNGTNLIFTTSADFYNGITSVREKIIHLLELQNVPMNPLTIEQKTKKLAIPLSRSVECLIKLISGFIALMKANGQTISDIIDSINDLDINKFRNTFLLQNLVQPLYDVYIEYLAENSECDFTDCLLNASKLLANKQFYDYDYILVDEFQDMSLDKYTYLNALRRINPRTRIFCVGDDWQSIYRFSGSDITLFSKFEKFNGPTDELKIEATHRFGEPLLERSSSFILKNPAQKKKKLKADNAIETFLAFVEYENEIEERSIIEKQIARLPQDARIYIVSRYRYHIGSVFPEVANVVRGEQGGAVELTIAGRKVQALTAHSCKGLEADYVFLINCNSGYDDFGFPSQVSDDPILEYVLSSSDSFGHAEERRVFYVAITRAKRATYVLYDKQYPSLFVTELVPEKSATSNKKRICPRCGTGILLYKKDGYAKNGHFYTVIRCTNKNCDIDNEYIFFNPTKYPYKIVPFEYFLKSRRVTTEECAHIHVDKSPYFSFPVLLVPCAADKEKVLYISIDPRYEKYDISRFYQEHLNKGDLAVCVQNSGFIERLLLTIKRN